MREKSTTLSMTPLVGAAVGRASEKMAVPAAECVVMYRESGRRSLGARRWEEDIFWNYEGRLWCFARNVVPFLGAGNAWVGF